MDQDPDPHFSQDFAKQVGRDVFRDFNEILQDKERNHFQKKRLKKQILQIVPESREKCGLTFSA